ncbi:MAG: DoxX family protein [Saprospiraceae bacterium]|nr:DoxX family protein [Saprospiraceae bacterium]
MTIYTLVLNIAIVALIVTLAMGFIWKIHKSWVMSFLQNFSGILFIFSGWVKAVDPMGTAIKMEDYFAEFYTTFAGTSFDFLAPLFPLLSQYSLLFGIVMIIFEIVLGLMLIMGAYPKITSWAFLLLVLFFTGLTGFTFLTGYVPGGTNFFQFSDWGPYKVTNMRVTDCGCFGDFIKLEPRISFYKDLVLLIPSFYFIFNYSKMHQLFTVKLRNIILGVSTLFLIFYSLYNFYWDEPHIDFRPFKKGANIAEIKAQESAAMAAVKVTSYKLTNKSTGEVKEIEYNQYLKEYESYPKEEWDAEQIKTEPTIKPTKISEFSIVDFDGNDKEDIFLKSENFVLMLLSGKAPYKAIPVMQMVTDSIFTSDTINVAGFKDSVRIEKVLKEVQEREERTYNIEWDKNFMNILQTDIKNFTDKAKVAGVEVTYVMSGVDAAKVKTLEEQIGLGIAYYTADEKLLKTISRSNPGILLWKNGVILEKWHYKKLPDFEKVKERYSLK